MIDELEMKIMYDKIMNCGGNKTNNGNVKKDNCIYLKKVAVLMTNNKIKVSS